MRIGMVLDHEFPGDIRVENEIIALENAGFEVFIICFDFGIGSTVEYFHRTKIVRIKINKSIKKKLQALTNTIFNFYPKYWAKKINKFIDNYKIDVLHIHDLYMFGAGILIKEKYKRKILLVGDLHENYVEGLKKYQFSNTFPGKFLISIPKWEKSEIEWIHKLDYAITVIEEAVDRYESLGLDRRKFSVVANYVNIDEYLKILNAYEVRKDMSLFTATYLGVFDTHRGLESVVRSIPFIKKSVENIKFVLVGRGKNLESLKKMAGDLDVLNNISFEGWQPHEKLPAYINASDICLIPHLKTVHTDNTIPHKLFQYMLFEKPVVATNCNPIQRIVEETKCGLIYENKNSYQFAEAVIKLYNSESLRQQMGTNGKKAVMEKYNWTTTSENLISMYQIIGEDMKK